MLDVKQKEALRRWYRRPEILDQARKRIEDKYWEDLEEIVHMRSLMPLVRTKDLPDWLKNERTTIPGAPDLGRRLVKEIMQTVDTAYAEEWKFDHGIMVPLHFLTPRYDLPIIPVNINCQGPPLSVWQNMPKNTRW